MSLYTSVNEMVGTGNPTIVGLSSPTKLDRIIKMKISDQNELGDLLSADAYKELIGA